MSRRLFARNNEGAHTGEGTGTHWHALEYSPIGIQTHKTLQRTMNVDACQHAHAQSRSPRDFLRPRLRSSSTFSRRIRFSGPLPRRRPQQQAPAQSCTVDALVRNMRPPTLIIASHGRSRWNGPNGEEEILDKAQAVVDMVPDLEAHTIIWRDKYLSAARAGYRPAGATRSASNSPIDSWSNTMRFAQRTFSFLAYDNSSSVPCASQTAAGRSSLTLAPAPRFEQAIQVVALDGQYHRRQGSLPVVVAAPTRPGNTMNTLRVPSTQTPNGSGKMLGKRTGEEVLTAVCVDAERVKRDTDGGWRNRRRVEGLRVLDIRDPTSRAEIMAQQGRRALPSLRATLCSTFAHADDMAGDLREDGRMAPLAPRPLSLGCDCRDTSSAEISEAMMCVALCRTRICVSSARRATATSARCREWGNGTTGFTGLKTFRFG
uniref:Uncharacterized protein n=1 Tax=Mycena chlorophos TaxID=658473 RepID=A0ABQ0LJL2_MYCCL|nr:predicted protein [Mycena chlorophos]